MIKLFEDKSKCCGCTACMNICPQNAITMKEDKYGYEYPVINEELCTECGLCQKVCMYKKDNDINKPVSIYAGIANDYNLLFKSASGGAFATVAERIIEKGGIVFGCAYDKDMIARQIGIESKDELYKLQGSKYVQSDVSLSYKQVKENLNNGRLVLFSGTPCQIAGLKGYLLKEYKN